MPRYLLLSYLPTDPATADAPDPAAPENRAAEHARWMEYDQAVKDSKAFVSNAGLAQAAVATTVRVRGGKWSPPGARPWTGSAARSPRPRGRPASPRTGRRKGGRNRRRNRTRRTTA